MALALDKARRTTGEGRIIMAFWSLFDWWVIGHGRHPMDLSKSIAKLGESMTATQYFMAAGRAKGTALKAGHGTTSWQPEDWVEFCDFVWLLCNPSDPSVKKLKPNPLKTKIRQHIKNGRMVDLRDYRSIDDLKSDWTTASMDNTAAPAVAADADEDLGPGDHPGQEDNGDESHCDDDKAEPPQGSADDDTERLSDPIPGDEVATAKVTTQANKTKETHKIAKATKTVGAATKGKKTKKVKKPSTVLDDDTVTGTVSQQDEPSFLRFWTCRVRADAGSTSETEIDAETAEPAAENGNEMEREVRGPRSPLRPSSFAFWLTHLYSQSNEMIVRGARRKRKAKDPETHAPNKRRKPVAMTTVAMTTVAASDDKSDPETATAPNQPAESKDDEVPDGHATDDDDDDDVDMTPAEDHPLEDKTADDQGTPIRKGLDGQHAALPGPDDDGDLAIQPPEPAVAADIDGEPDEEPGQSAADTDYSERELRLLALLAQRDREIKRRDQEIHKLRKVQSVSLAVQPSDTAFVRKIKRLLTRALKETEAAREEADRYKRRVAELEARVNEGSSAGNAVVA